jgi:predicted regulator of amino acid metabolism with ACT domain
MNLSPTPFRQQIIENLHDQGIRLPKNEKDINIDHKKVKGTSGTYRVTVYWSGVMHFLTFYED